LIVKNRWIFELQLTALIHTIGLPNGNDVSDSESSAPFAFANFNTKIHWLNPKFIGNETP
jgi:hypothetical protein